MEISYRPKPGEESKLSDRDLRVEKVASAGVGSLLLLLALATEISSIVSLSLHLKPETSNASLIISASALVIMILIWLPKRYLAKALNSSVMYGEAQCSLSCIQITVVLFIGSIIYRFWLNGWWVDSATSIILGGLFGWEGVKMIKWVRDPNFDGGCCCHDAGKNGADACNRDKAEDWKELQQPYRDLCECCLNKAECKESGSCQCGSSEGLQDVEGIISLNCCKPKSDDGSKCCTHNIVTRPKPELVDVCEGTTNERQERDECCSGCD